MHEKTFRKNAWKALLWYLTVKFKILPMNFQFAWRNFFSKPDLSVQISQFSDVKHIVISLKSTVSYIPNHIMNLVYFLLWQTSKKLLGSKTSLNWRKIVCHMPRWNMFFCVLLKIKILSKNVKFGQAFGIFEKQHLVSYFTNDVNFFSSS